MDKTYEEKKIKSLGLFKSDNINGLLTDLSDFEKTVLTEGKRQAYEEVIGKIQKMIENQPETGSTTCFGLKTSENICRYKLLIDF